MDRATFEALVYQAQDLERSRRWREVGDTWLRAANVALKARAIESARQAFDAAGEAYRRDDRPLRARQALMGALRLPGAADAEALSRARLAGVLGELGDGQGGVRLCAEVSDDLGPGARTLVLDTQIGLLQGFGRKEALRPAVGALRALEGEDGVAWRFRQGQLHRLDGDLELALGCFEHVRDRLAGRPGAQAGAAAAEMECADILSLQGDPGPAIAAYERGTVLHRAAARRALVYRCEAGRVRAAVAAGVAALTSILDEGLDFAERRGLVMLGIDVRLALGMALAGRDPAEADAMLLRAAIDAEQRGARLRAGRARFERATRIESSPSEARPLLQRAVVELDDHVPMRDRALAALRALG